MIGKLTLKKLNTTPDEPLTVSAVVQDNVYNNLYFKRIKWTGIMWLVPQEGGREIPMHNYNVDDKEVIGWITTEELTALLIPLYQSECLMYM